MYNYVNPHHDRIRLKELTSKTGAPGAPRLDYPAVVYVGDVAAGRRGFYVLEHRLEV